MCPHTDWQCQIGNNAAQGAIRLVGLAIAKACDLRLLLRCQSKTAESCIHLQPGLKVHRAWYLQLPDLLLVILLARQLKILCTFKSGCNDTSLANICMYKATNSP